MEQRRRTSTSNVGVGRRESHDATGFYDRFRPPELSDDEVVAPPQPVSEPFICGDARSMDAVADASVALVVTSPPYFAGKQYEEELQRDGVPSSYLEYLDLLTAVFAECVRTLEPGGRIAVNVANLGRKPYRSLSADVTRILVHDLGLMLRGDRSAVLPTRCSGTSPSASSSKGRAGHRRLHGPDARPLVDPARERPASRAPGALPRRAAARLIELYTYVDDLVLDPFMGSGSAMVAAAGLGRRYVGDDVDPARDSGGDPHLRRIAEEKGKTASRVAATALRAAGPSVVFDIVDLLSPQGRERLERYAKGDHTQTPAPGFWTTADLGRHKT